MRNIFISLCAVLVLLAGAGTLFAEEGHEPVAQDDEYGLPNPYRNTGTPINASQADIMARKVRDSMVSRGDLARSWASVSVKQTRQRTYEHEQEWVVVFSNPAEKIPGNKTLYIFLDLYGDVADVNYTGK